MPILYVLVVLALVVVFCAGGLCGQQIERGWWMRNLLDQDRLPPGIRRRLGL